MYREIDMTSDPRRAQFDYFLPFADPYASVTVECDITPLRRRAEKLPFFLSVLFCAVNAANEVPELRRRIRDGRVIEFDRCLSSHTVALDNGSYCYCTLDCGMPFADFLPYAQAAVAAAKANPGLEDGEDADRLFFVSSLPWLSFSAISLPVPSPADSNVRITFGKFFEREGKILLPVSLCVHHALADGIHIARFYENLANRICAL